MSNTVTFYNRVPDEIVIDRNWSCRPSEPQNAWKRPYLIQPCTVESITDSLARGPFAALAEVGPDCYTVAPIPFHRQIPGHEEVVVHGWRPGSTRIPSDATFVIICGVQRREGQEQIYYVLADDISEDPDVAIGQIRPSATDRKVYGTALKTFADNEVDLFPPVPEDEVRKKRNDPVVPTPFANRPDLIELWKQGKIEVTYIPRR